MSEIARQHLHHEFITCGGSNAIFNGLAAWLLLRGGPALTWSGEPSFMMDIVLTALLLPLIVALIVIPMQRRKLRSGKLQAISLGPDSTLQSFADRFSGSTFLAALTFGLLGVCVIAPITLVGFKLVGVMLIEPLHYVLFKSAWTGTIAALLVLPMVLVALRKDS